MKPALSYFLIVFAAGFLLGSIRTTWLAPAVGNSLAVLVELPFMLGVSVAASRYVLRRFAIVTLGRAAATGAVAFMLLLSAEAMLGILAFGMTPSAWLQSLFVLPGALGLAAQLLFAILPAIMVSAARPRM